MSKIIKYPNEVLTRKAANLDKGDILSSDIQTLIEEMKDGCYHTGGVGLAACQLGSEANICVYLIEPDTFQYGVIINPVIIAKSDRVTSYSEGCLSLPNRRFNVKRFKRITVKGLDEHGNSITVRPKTKMLAIILQHEIDHLNGTLIIDKGKEV